MFFTVNKILFDICIGRRLCVGNTTASHHPLRRTLPQSIYNCQYSDGWCLQLRIACVETFSQGVTDCWGIGYDWIWGNGWNFLLKVPKWESNTTTNCNGQQSTQQTSGSPLAPSQNKKVDQISGRRSSRGTIPYLYGLKIVHCDEVESENCVPCLRLPQQDLWIVDRHSSLSNNFQVYYCVYLGRLRNI